jgi:hypothetical protein
MDTTLKTIKKIINKENLKNYIIILGDSVAYSNPCPPENSIGYYMNSISKNEGKNIRIFNLAAPSMMIGDIYTMLKLLEKYDISTQNLIVDFCYWEFGVKNPVFWLTNHIKDLEPEIYKTVVLPRQKGKGNLWSNIKWRIISNLNSNISLLEYREFITFNLKKKVNYFLHEATPTVSPWYKKSSLPSIMKNPENKWFYSDNPYTFDKKNPDIYFLDKIIEMQKGKNTVFFLSAMNEKLLGDGASKLGYIQNMNKIDAYFGSKNVKFVNYNKKIDYNLFTDHVHLIPQGYKFLAGDLWKRINA